MLKPGSMVECIGSGISVMQELVPSVGVSNSDEQVGILRAGQVVIVVATLPWDSSSGLAGGHNLLLLCPTFMGWVLSYWVREIKV